MGRLKLEAGRRPGKQAPVYHDRGYRFHSISLGKSLSDFAYCHFFPPTSSQKRKNFIHSFDSYLSNTNHISSWVQCLKSCDL